MESTNRQRQKSGLTSVTDAGLWLTHDDFAIISVDYALIFAVYDHITVVYALIFGVYALMFTVYEGIFGNYEPCSNVYDLIFGDYEGRIAGNEGIFGVLKGRIRRFAVLNPSVFSPKTSVFHQKLLPDARLAGIKARNQTKARACLSTIHLQLTIVACCTTTRPRRNPISFISGQPWLRGLSGLASDL